MNPTTAYTDMEAVEIMRGAFSDPDTESKKVLASAKCLMWGLRKQVLSGGKFNIMEYLHIDKRTTARFVRETFLDSLDDLRMVIGVPQEPTRKHVHLMLDFLTQLSDLRKSGLDHELKSYEIGSAIIVPPSGVNIGDFDEALANIVKVLKLPNCPTLPTTYRSLRDLLQEKLTGKTEYQRQKKARFDKIGGNGHKLKVVARA